MVTKVTVNSGLMSGTKLNALLKWHQVKLEKEVKVADKYHQDEDSGGGEVTT